MDWKQILKPKTATIILFIILFILTTFFLQQYYEGGPTRVGFPLSYYVRESFPTQLVPVDSATIQPGHFSSYGGLVADIIFWYILSHLIILIYYNFRKN